MARMTEGKETWHRLLEWDRGQTPAEGLSAAILIAEGYKRTNPSHPLGGPDGKKDLVFFDANNNKWIAGVYFPHGRQTFAKIKKKFTYDLSGVSTNNAYGFAFITNQEITLSDRDKLIEICNGIPVEIYHLERISAILNAPVNYGVRLEYLDIEMSKEEQLSFFASLNTAASKPRPSLAVKGILNDRINDDLFVFERNWTNSGDMRQKEEEIIRLYKKICEMVVSQRDDLISSVNKHLAKTELKEVVDVEISDDIRNKISDYFIGKSIDLPNSFFSLGNLQMQTSILFSYYGDAEAGLQGDDEEKAKYESIMELYYSICERNGFSTYYKALEGLFFVKCVLDNTGETYDEDVDVKLIFPENHICHPDDLPRPDHSIISWFNENSYEQEIFKLKLLVDVIEYPDYPEAFFLPPPDIAFSLFQARATGMEKYVEQTDIYTDSIDELFCYKFRKATQSDVWSFNVPFIKQNTIVSFPSLLVFNKLPQYLEYEIRSKHLPTVTSGRVQIKTEN